MYIELITGVLEMFHVVVATGWQQDHMLFVIGTHCILREVGQSSGKSAFANRLDIGLIRQNITNSTVVTLPDNLRGYHIK